MKKIHNLLLLMLSVSSFGVGSVAYAADTRTIKTPYNQKGEQAHPLYSGCDYKRVTAAVETLISSGPIVLYGVYLTTGAATQFVTIRDAQIVDGTGSVALDRIPFATTAQQERNILPFPVRLSNGGTITLGGSTLAGGDAATACYLKQQ